MKPIADSIKKLSSDRQQELAELLKCSPSEKSILHTVLSKAGIYELLKSLNVLERKIISEVYASEDGITLGELSGRLGAPAQKIEAASDSLSAKLLVYNIKNRQLLTNKLDKIYAIEEIAPALCLNEDDGLAAKIRTLIKALEEGDADDELLNKPRPPALEKLIELLAENGGVLSFEAAAAAFPNGRLAGILEKAFGEGTAQACYSITPDFHAYIVINEKLLTAAVSRPPKSVKPVNNGYRFAINMLRSYDAISSYGLFLTRQMVFRKVDYKRIASAMINITCRNGSMADNESVCGLTLFFFAAMKSLRIDRGAAKINLSGLKKYIENPNVFTGVMLKALDEDVDEIFALPSAAPPYKTAALIIKLLHRLNAVSESRLKALLLATALHTEKEDLHKAIQNTDKKKAEIAAALDLLCIIGTIEIRDDGKYALSDAGYETAQFLYKLKSPEQEMHRNKRIYINPDYSIMMPVLEMPSLCAYHIMFWSEIVKDDVLLSVKVTSSSILTAQKRGFSPERFIEMLKECSQNEMPKNMEFQLGEWSKQTLKITVNDAVLIRSNRLDFFEELIYLKGEETAKRHIEILNPNCAAISRKYIDDVVELAAKHNAVISLFEEQEESED